MSLKKLVNDNEIYEAFLQHIDDLIYLQHRQMEQASESVLFYRAQGAISQLRKLKHLREQINHGSKP
jgi:coproporphyrinogen III oxidase